MPHPRPRLNNEKGMMDTVLETRNSDSICGRPGAMIDAAKVLYIDSSISNH